MIEKVIARHPGDIDAVQLAKTEMVVKLVHIQLHSIAVYTSGLDPVFAEYVRKFDVFTDLEKLDAKVPYFTGMNYRIVSPAASGAYLTLWPVHPAPLHFSPEDYCMVVMMSGNAPDIIPKLKFKRPTDPEPVKLMEELLKHLFGWLK